MPPCPELQKCAEALAETLTETVTKALIETHTETLAETQRHTQVSYHRTRQVSYQGGPEGKKRRDQSTRAAGKEQYCALERHTGQALLQRRETQRR